MNLFLKMLIGWISTLILLLIIDKILKSNKEKGRFWSKMWEMWRLPWDMWIVVLIVIIFLAILFFGSSGELPEGFYPQDFWGRN